MPHVSCPCSLFGLLCLGLPFYLIPLPRLFEGIDEKGRPLVDLKTTSVLRFIYLLVYLCTLYREFST